MTLRDLYYNYTGYPNVYEGGGFGNFFRGVGRWVKHPFNKTARYNASVQSNPDSYGSGEITNFNTTGNGTTDWGSMGGFATGQTSQNNITNPYQGTTMMEQSFAQTGTPNGETVDGNAFADISKSGKSEGTWTRGGGGVPWGSIISAAGTNIANAFLDTEASTAERVAGALGIPALANQWRADTSKGDAYIKDMQNSMDLNSKNYIQDASSSWGGANAVKQNLKTNISPISFNSAVPSLKDFKGNWWRNMGASVAQGAASGSVGGPWGALGGAVTGLFGSIGGLFGRSKRADRAHKDFLAKRNTLVSAQEAAYNRAVKDQTLSNMQALANGNMQQRINDMANIRAFGGNLFANGGGFIDPDPETITAEDIEKARLDAYYPNRLSDTFLGSPVGYLSEDAGLESYAPIIGTIQDWDKFVAEPTVGNAVWAGLSTIGDIPWLKMGGIGLRALKRGWDAYNTYRKVAKALNKTKAVGEFGEAADALRDLRKVMPDPEYTQMRRQIIAPTRDKDVIEGVKDYYKHEGAKLASQLGKQFKKPLTYSDFAINFAQNQVGGGDNYIPEDKKIISNNGVVFSYNPSSRTWISENSGPKGEKIVVPAEEMQQHLQNGLGKVINNNTEYAMGGNLFDGGGDLTDEQQIALADIQANPRILFTPKYSQWRDYIRRTSPNYLDRLYTSLPYEQQQDIYQNDREAWGALSNEAKGNFGGSQVRKKTDEVSPYVAGALGLVGAAPAMEAITMFPMLENGLNAYFGYEGAKDLPSAIYDTYNYAKNGDWSNAGLNLGKTALDGLFLKNGISAVKNTAKKVLPVVKGKYRQNEINSTTNKAESEISDKDWDIAYNAAIKANDMVKAQRLRNAHFLEKAGNDAISKNGHPEIMYHSVDPMYDPKFNSFDTNIEGRKTFVYTTNNKNMSRSYTKGQEFNKDMYRPAAEYAADADIAENRNGLLTREQLIDKYIKEFSKGLESKANTTKELYGKLNNPWIIEGNYHNWDNIPTRFSEYNEIVPVERSTREVEDLIQINNEIGNKKYDGAIMNNISDWGSGYLQPERDIFTLNTLEPTVKPNPDFYGTVYSFENPKNLKYRDAITYDDAGNIIPLSKRDNFNINDLRYGLIPFLGLTGYGLTNNTGYAMGGNLYTDLSPNMMNLWNNKQQIDQQKVNMQQMNFGLGNSFNQKINKYDFGGSMNGMDLPTGMQSYENGGTHEENPYGGIQVGVDQQGNPNLVEEGEFRWGDYIFSDRINVDPTLLSRYNLAPATKHQGKKANKGKLSYADMAKKYAKKNNELANDPIGKNTLEAYMKRLQDAQEDQKFQDSMEQQKQDAINQYRKTLSTPTQGNPMYGAMKYNGMGNAATQQGVNAGMSDLGQQSSGNEVLSNTNRSGNNMLHALGGNLFWRGSFLKKDPPPYGDPNSRIDYAMSYVGTPTYNGNSRIDFANQYMADADKTNDYGVSDFMNRIYSGNVGFGSPKVNTTVAQTQTPQNFQEWALWQHDNGNKPYVGSANTGVEPDAFALQAQGRTADGSTADADYTTGYNGTSNTNTNSSNLTGNINTGNTTTGTYATNAFKEDREGVPLYSTAGKFATFGKGLTPMLYDWINKTNFKYDPNQRPANELVNMGNNSTFLRTADTIGGYRAPNLMDAERMNNAAQAQGLAALQAAFNVGNRNRGFAATQAAQNAYNTQMSIGNNYATAQQANNEERYKTDAYNTAIDQFNANARNTSYQDNQRAEQVGQQMALSAKQAANDYLQKENWYADRTNRTAMDNRATNQAAWTDNALNYFITQAQENAERNRQNNDITKRYWSDKDGVMHYIGDSGLNGKIREYFRKNNIDNGTFTGDRLTAFNSIIQNNKAKDVANEKGELWSTVQGLMDDEIAARNKEIADADKAKADELQEYRDQFDSELAQLQRYGSDKMYGDYWRNQADLDYYSGATGKFKRDEQSLSQLRNAIARLKGYNERYNKWTPQNVTAYGGRINNGNKNNKNGYYTYTY